MEDALISPEGFMILSGAGLIEATADRPIYQHVFETTDDVVVAEGGEDVGVNGFAVEAGDIIIYLKEPAYMPNYEHDNYAYVMVRNDEEELVTEPIIPFHWETNAQDWEDQKPVMFKGESKYPIVIRKAEIDEADFWGKNHEAGGYVLDDANYNELSGSTVVLVDYYVKRKGGAKQINITADKFGGNYYLEASTLFRNTNGVDEPAEFIIPNCKIQSNFTFTMASTGDPSSFTFTMDAFPDYTRFDKTKKVLAALQIISTTGETGIERHATEHDSDHNKHFVD